MKTASTSVPELSISFLSFEKEVLNTVKKEIVTAEIIGIWDLYRRENLKSVINQWTDIKWTTKDENFQNIRKDLEVSIEFKKDGTFRELCIDVETGNGVWGISNDGNYYFEYTTQYSDTNEQLKKRHHINIHSDNTFSIQIEGNDKIINHYKKIGNTKYSDLISYKEVI